MHSAAEHVLKISNLKKSYTLEGAEIPILNDVALAIGSGESCALVGHSGSGKTTLLGICAGLEQPSSGSVSLCGEELTSKTEAELAALRKRHVGFVFQTFQLIPTLTALENVMVPIQLQGGSDAVNRAKSMLERVGLAKRSKHYPLQLSGGEQQRVALARAFVNRPKILFADEPTGNLDEQTAAVVEELLFELNREHGTALFIATHNQLLAAKTQRILRLSGGELSESPLI